MQRYNLNSDGSQWADIKDVGEMNSGDKRAVKASVSIEIDPETGHRLIPGDMDERMTNALLRRIVVAWSLPFQLPKVNPAVLDELSTDVWDALDKAIKPHIDKLNEDAAGPNTEGSVPTSA